ncbi:MAG: InlB B-repeat-containing protein [Akkermansiaceae bacterium]
MNLARHPSIRRALPVIATVLMAAVALGQTWRSTLYPENWQRPGESVSFTSAKLIQDFSYAGYKRGEQAIPNVVGPVFNVTTYGADATGATDSTVAIQNAINAAASAGGGVVFLPAGQFRVSPQGTNNFCLRISTSNIVLRGAGTGTTGTFLLNTSHKMRDKTVIRVSSPSLSYGTAGSLTADLPGPTRRIPVQNASSFAPGNIVRLQWSFTDAWITENNQETWWNATNGRPSSATYLREVTATNSTQGWIEIDVPTRYSMKTRDSARMQRVTGFISGVGIESLAIGNLQHPGTGWGETEHSDPTKAAYDTDRSYLISIRDAQDSWISNVHSRQATGNTSTCHMLSNGILLFNSMRVTVQNCQMRRPQYGGGNGNGYMYRMTASSECLVKNSIADFSRHGLVISGAGTSGNVYFQCEDRNTQRATGSTGSYNTSGSGSDNHSHFSHSNLWDQCHAHNSFYTAHHRTFFGSTPPHGVTSAHGVYWNTSGSGTRYANSSNPIVRSEQLHYGYVIGTKATSGTAYFASNTTGGNTAPADHLEGINSGATLFPQSLYLDQLSRRLQPAVIYRGNGATAGTAPVDAASPYAPGATVTVLGAGSLVKTGFAFAGWNTAPDGSGTTYAAGSTFGITGSTHLYAQWFGQPYTVTFNANGGSAPDPVTKVVEFGATYGMLPTIVRTGYEFTGWFSTLTGGNLVTSASNVTTASNHTLFARWNARPVVIAGSDQFVTLAAQTLWTPALISARAWYDAADANSITIISGKVSQWNDKSANNRHATQTTAANRPTYVASDSLINNLPSIGNNVLAGKIGLNTPSVSAKNVYVVSYYNTGVETTFSGYPTLFSGPGSFGLYRVMGDGNPTAPTANFIATSQFNNAGTFKNGASVSSFTALPMAASIYKFKSSVARTQVFSLGYNAATVDRNWQGSYSEWVLTDGSEDLDTEQKMEGYLAHKWGLAASLPGGHPHKNVPPVAAVAIATLNATVSDLENNTLTRAWTVLSGPAAVTFANASSANTTAHFFTNGTYTLRLTVNDGFSTSFDELVITVGAPTNYSVIYSGNGATGGTAPVDANSPYPPGGNVTILGQGDLTRIGYIFAGWNTSASGSGTYFEEDDNYTINSSDILYAQWIPNLYTLSFDANGGSVPDPASMQVTYAEPYGTLASTSRAGFTFAGWFTAPAGGDLVTADSPVSIAANHTLYARWTAVLAATTPIKHFIRGETENPTTLPLGYFQNPNAVVGTGGATGSRDDRNPVFGFTLPTLPAGATLDSATFNFEITAAFDTTGGQNLPGLHVYLLDSADPTSTGTTFFYHGIEDPSASSKRIGTTSVTISGTTSVPFPAGQEVRSFTLSGDALTLLKSYYNGNTPTRSKAYFRFNLSVDSTTVSLRRYTVNTTEAGSSLQLVYNITVQTAFDGWVTEHGGAEDNITFGGDSNGDDIADGLAWLLGAETPSANASGLLPVIHHNNGELSVSFHYLVTGKRGSSTLRLQHGETLATDSWTDVAIPDESDTVDGVEFLITPVPASDLNQVHATIPPGDAGRIFIRLAAELPIP